MEQNDSKNSHWQSLEQLKSEPEFLERKGKEFPLPPDEQSVTEMERRTFLKLMGASLLLTSTAACHRPVEKIIPYVNRPLEVVPGLPNWYTSTCRECSAACGTLVKTREGRPLKVEGNPEHPMNRGGLCARGQMSVLNQYDPDRFQNPGLNSESGFEKLTWEKLDQEVVSKLKTATQGGKKVAVLTGALTSPTTKKLIDSFLSVYPGSHISYDGVIPEEIAQGREIAFGQKLVPHYYFEKASVIVSFGADFLGTWLSPVEFARGYAMSRQPEKGRMSRLSVVESALSLTGSNADEYLPVKSGHELTIALGILSEILSTQSGSLGAAAASARALVGSTTLDSAAAATGIGPAILKKLADSLLQARGKGIVLGGAVRGANALALQVAVNYINLALGNEGSTIDATKPSYQASSSFSDFQTLAQEIEAGKIGALLVYKSNPAYDAPWASLKEDLKKVPLLISFADRPNETAAIANVLAPASGPMEAWDDASPRAGLLSLVQPTMQPLFNTRSFQDSLIKWAGLQPGNWYDYLRNNWEATFFPATSGFSSFDILWNTVLQKGFVTTDINNGATTSGVAADVSKLPVEKAADLSLSLYPNISIFDGHAAQNSFLQELPDPLSKITWENYFSISPADAKTHNLSQGEIISVETAEGTLELPVHIQPKMPQGNIMAAIGYGRKTSLSMPNAIGKNASVLQRINGNSLAWAGLAVTNLKKTGMTNRFGITQGHHELEGRDIVQEATFEEYKKDPHAGAEGHHGEVPTMWTEHKYDGYRWGMAVDMSACVGCNACMAACQVENNVPVVGKEQVFRGRDMHWLRIDRYYKGDENYPEVAYQPMFCQNCENAPCETVCPVIATVHNDDGINVMVYNRCVGTRYCLNNCPYKVRRFNYFDYWKGLKAPANLALNPEMTVRTKGVMEKCNFCLQRIRYSKDAAKDQNRRVVEGEIQTACEQSCPTHAIVFGDLNDPKSLVSKMKASTRGYHVLEDLNVKSRVTYLRKIRNTEA